MSKNTAAIAWEIAEKRDAKRIEGVKEEFLDIMRGEFEKCVKECKPWEAIDEQYKPFKLEGFKKDDLERVCLLTGFRLKTQGSVYLISVPSWKKGERKTHAQRLLESANKEIKKRIRLETQRAKQFCKEVLQRIREGDFESNKLYTDTYKIHLNINCTTSDPFIQQVEKIFKENGFGRLSIDEENGFLSVELRAA